MPKLKHENDSRIWITGLPDGLKAWLKKKAKGSGAGSVSNWARMHFMKVKHEEERRELMVTARGSGPKAEEAQRLLGLRE